MRSKQWYLDKLTQAYQQITNLRLDMEEHGVEFKNRFIQRINNLGSTDNTANLSNNQIKARIDKLQKMTDRQKLTDEGMKSFTPSYYKDPNLKYEDEDTGTSRDTWRGDLAKSEYMQMYKEDYHIPEAPQKPEIGEPGYQKKLKKYNKDLKKYEKQMSENNKNVILKWIDDMMHNIMHRVGYNGKAWEKGTPVNARSGANQLDYVTPFVELRSEVDSKKQVTQEEYENMVNRVMDRFVYDYGSDADTTLQTVDSIISDSKRYLHI